MTLYVCPVCGSQHEFMSLAVLCQVTHPGPIGPETPVVLEGEERPS